MKHYILHFMCLFIGTNAFSQDPNYSQFYNNPIYYNPAMTAINNGTTIRLNARNLWGPIPGRFNTFGASIDAQSVYKMGFGANVYTDVAGEGLLRTTAGYLTYSYRMIDSKNVILQLGASGGLVNKQIDWSKLTFSDQLDETLGKVNSTAFVSPNYRSTAYADFNTGAVLRFNGKMKSQSGPLKKLNVTFGIAMQHLNQPKDAFLGDKEKIPVRYVLHGTVNMLVNDLIFSPGIIYENQNQFRTFSIGMNLVNRPFTFGLWFRNRTAAFSGKQFDSFTFNIGMNLPGNDKLVWKLMYGFDMTISRLKTSAFGTHEVTLVFDLGKKVLFQSAVKKKASKRAFECPKDFAGYL